MFKIEIILERLPVVAKKIMSVSKKPGQTIVCTVLLLWFVQVFFETDVTLCHMTLRGLSTDLYPRFLVHLVP